MHLLMFTTHYQYIAAAHLVHCHTTQQPNLFDVAKCPRLRGHVLHHSRDDNGGTGEGIVVKELPKAEIIDTPPCHLRSRLKRMKTVGACYYCRTSFNLERNHALRIRIYAYTMCKLLNTQFAFKI